MAERNFKVVLVGNSNSKLQSIVKEIGRFNTCMYNLIGIIEDVFGTEVFGIYADFTKGPRVFEEIKELLTGFEIGVLGVSVCLYLCVCVCMHTVCVFVCACARVYLISWN